MRYNWRGSPYHMITHALQTSTPFVYEMFRIGYCIRSNCTSVKYFLYKWSTVYKACIIIWWGKPRHLYLPFILYSLHQFPKVRLGQFWGCKSDLALWLGWTSGPSTVISDWKIVHLEIWENTCGSCCFKSDMNTRKKPLSHGILHKQGFLGKWPSFVSK